MSILCKYESFNNNNNTIIIITLLYKWVIEINMYSFAIILNEYILFLNIIIECVTF